VQLHQPNAQLYIPDGAPEAEALARTTHLAIAAHQDDLDLTDYVMGYIQRFADDVRGRLESMRKE